MSGGRWNWLIQFFSYIDAILWIFYSVNWIWWCRLSYWKFSYILSGHLSFSNWIFSFLKGYNKYLNLLSVLKNLQYSIYEWMWAVKYKFFRSLTSKPTHTRWKLSSNSFMQRCLNNTIVTAYHWNPIIHVICKSQV